jgi:Family of unknown function (DUF6297)
VIAGTEVERARAARAFLGARRATRLRISAYHVYVVVLFGALGWLFLKGAILSAFAGGLSAHRLAMLGPAVLLLVVLAALRFGTWQGPVSFSMSDVGLLLIAPVAMEEFTRPKLLHALGFGAAAGVLVAGLLVLLVAGGSGALGLWHILGAVGSLAGLGTGCVAASWIVESSQRAARIVRRASPLVTVLAVGLLVAASTGALGLSVALWSGPWGWALAPFASTAAWPVAVPASAAFAMLLIVLGWRRLASTTPEVFVARAETRSSLAGAAFALDYRSAVLARRAAVPRPGVRWRGPRHPQRRQFVVLWRDGLAMVRDPYRFVSAALLCAGATVEALTHPGRVAAAILATGALYCAASLLCEPLRIDVDDPARAERLLSRRFSRVLIAHCVLPTAALVSLASATIVAMVLAGAVSTAALVSIPTVLLPIAAAAVLAAALSTRRGGRINERLLTTMLGSDAMSPAGATLIVISLAPWVLFSIAANGASLLIIGHAAAHHHSLLSASVLGLALSSAVATCLLAAARQTHRPE